MNTKKLYLEDIDCRGELDHSDIVHKSVGFVINNAIDKDGKDIYNATTGCWKCSLERVSGVDLIFSLYRTMIVGVWIPKKWEEATNGTRVRWEGIECTDEAILNRYLYKKSPKAYSVVRYYGDNKK